MDIGFLHLHETVVVLFFVLLLSKVIVLLSGKKGLLQKVRRKTKILEIVLGSLILTTGLYLFFHKVHHPPYLYGKLILVLTSTPLAIIGFNRENRFLAILSLLMIIYVFGIAETKSLVFKPKKFDLEAAMSKAGEDEAPGRVIYQNLCTDCHGQDGKKGAFKAPDLTMSKLTDLQKEDRIKLGKGIMRGYSKVLTDSEIQQVILYIDSLE